MMQPAGITNIYDLPCFINDAMCELDNKAYHKTDEIMKEAQQLIDIANTRVKYLASCIRTWSYCIIENGLTAETEHEIRYLNIDNKELQEITAILMEVDDFMLRLRNDVGYQNYNQKTA